MNKYCVYLHKDKEGNVRYVGSGNRERPYSLTNRSKEHREMLNDLSVEIVKSGLSKREAIYLENELYNFNVSNGLLLNKVPPCAVNMLDYDAISMYVEYNESSKSKLVWKESDRFGKRCKGEQAGSLDVSKGYYRVKILNKRYYVHRVIWVLFTKQDIPEGVVIDHIDRNGANNSISNLRVVSQSENMLNAERSGRVEKGRREYKRNTRNSSGVTGLYWSNINNVWMVEKRVKSVEYRKRFNPRKLFPDLDQHTAKEKSFVIAVSFIESLNRQS